MSDFFLFVNMGVIIGFLWGISYSLYKIRILLSSIDDTLDNIEEKM